MLNSKQKSQLKTMATHLSAIGQIGKDGIKENLLDFLNDVLTSHELIKVKVHKSCSVSLNELIIEISRELHCDLVQTIGRVLIFYRKSKENQRIKLVK